MPDNDTIPPLPKGYVAVNNNDTEAPPLPKGYFDIKKKVNGGVSGLGQGNGSQNGSTPTNGFLESVNQYNIQHQGQQPNISNLGVDTGMQAPDTGAIKVQEQKTAKQAAINNAHDYFDNNKPLLEQLAKNNDKLLAKDKDGKPIEGEYSDKELEKTPAFNQKVSEIMDAAKNGTLALTHYQNGSKIGQPTYTRPEGFWGSLVGSFTNSLNSTTDALKTMFKSNKDLADYYDKQRENLPNVPESVPVGVGSMMGNMGGSMIKPVTEFAAGEAIAPEGGGLIAAGADIIPTTTSEKTKEIYLDRMNALEAQYGKGKVPEADRLDAIQKARSQAPLQALPNEAMQLYLFGKGAGTIEDAANQEALQSFGNVVQKSGADIGKMAALGGTSELATQSIKQLQSGNGKFDENISQAAGQWALMEAAFKALPITSKALGTVYSKFVSSSAKNAMATADPNVVQNLSEQAVQQGWLTPEQANATVQDVNDFAKIKQTIPSNISEDKSSLIAGLIQKNKDLVAQKQKVNPIFHDDINAQIAANEEKAKQILNSNQPLKYETDNLTGERGQNVGGRPSTTTQEESQAQTEKPIQETNVGTTTANEPTEQSANESSTTKENVGEVIQPKQNETGANKIEPVKVGKVDVSEHGEDTNTKNNLENGTESTSLTNKGKEEATALGKYIYDHDQYEIVTSDVERAEKTANKAAEEVNRLRGIKKGTPMEEANGIKVETNPLLKTWNIGEYDGKPEGSFDENNWANNPDKAPKGGESFNDFKDRMLKAYDYVKTLPETTHVITHSKVMRAFEALNKTDGKWTDETTQDFLNNKETIQPQQKDEVVTVYRGLRSNVDEEGGYKAGKFVTTNKANAERYSKNIGEFTIPKNLKTLKYDSPEADNLVREFLEGLPEDKGGIEKGSKIDTDDKMYLFHGEAEHSWVDFLKGKGYEATSIINESLGKNNPSEEIHVFDPSVIKKSPIEEQQTTKINDLQEQKYSKMKDDIKDETKLNLIPSKDLVKAKEPIEAKKTHDDIKDRYKTLKKLIDCI